MESFKNNEATGVVLDLIKTIQEGKDYLSEVDGAIGDGDHGTNMNKGFTLCETRLNGEAVGLSKALGTLGRVLLMEIGGSMGPLYGKFFMAMGKASEETEVIDADVFLSMIKGALEGVMDIGNAKQGDKTLLDCLIPAVEAFESANAEGKSFSQALVAMKAAAEDGKNKTKNMVAKVGRAARLGERSRGVLDAGATSCCMILTTMADSITKLV